MAIEIILPSDVYYRAKISTQCIIFLSLKRLIMRTAYHNIK